MVNNRLVGCEGRRERRWKGRRKGVESEHGRRLRGVERRRADGGSASRGYTGETTKRDKKIVTSDGLTTRQERVERKSWNWCKTQMNSDDIVVLLSTGTGGLPEYVRYLVGLVTMARTLPRGQRQKGGAER